MSNGAEIVADALMDSLLTGETFTVPTVNLNDPAFNFPSIVGNPLYNAVAELTNEDLTTRTVGGSGTYDAIMASQAAHLKDEFNQGRITGAEYTKAYIALAQAAAGQAIQFLLGKDQAYWASVIAQGQALTARVQHETAKVQLAIAVVEMNNQRATFALNKIRLANEDAQYGINKYNLDNMLPAQFSNLIAEGLNIPKQGSLIDAQIIKMGKDSAIATQEILVKQQQVLIAEAEVGIAQAKLVNIPKEGLQLDAQTAVAVQQKGNLVDSLLTATAQRIKLAQETANLLVEESNITKQGTLIDANKAVQEAQKLSVEKATEIADYNLDNLMPAQLVLITEQGEVQRAQTLDTRSDTAAVAGSVKSQKDLYAQQVISYQRSAQTNAAKVWVDSWVADSALQDSPTVPTGFTAANIGAVLTTLKTENSL